MRLNFNQQTKSKTVDFKTNGDIIWPLRSLDLIKIWAIYM